MSLPSLKFSIGATRDRSFDVVLRGMEDRARKSARIIGTEMSRAMAGRSRGGVVGSDIVRPQEQAARRTAQVHKRAALDAEQAWRRAAKNAAAQMERDHARAAQRMARQQERAMNQAFRRQARTAESMARRTSHRTTRFFWPNAPITSIARRGIGDLLRGVGVETHLGGLSARVAQGQQLAAAVSVQGYRAGAAGEAGRRVGPGTLQKEARAVGSEFAIATEEILAGQKAFVDLEGDLEGARNVTADMARLSKSQAANFTEVMHTAAKANQMFAEMPEYMGDTEKRTAAVNDLMHRLVYQGKVGSITMEHMAKHFAKLSGTAGQFESRDRMQTVLQLTGMAQMAEAGAAKNPAQATTWAQ